MNSHWNVFFNSSWPSESIPYVVATYDGEYHVLHGPIKPEQAVLACLAYWMVLPLAPVHADLLDVVV
jgi:hypothetical protein